jgi:hypothetical protein
LASLEEAFMELTEDSVDYRGESGFSADPDLGHNELRLSPTGK